ncbi:MAG: TlpA disulfide reductase family protein [Hyphomicrobiales bacterium]
MATDAPHVPPRQSSRGPLPLMALIAILVLFVALQPVLTNALRNWTAQPVPEATIPPRPLPRLQLVGPDGAAASLDAYSGRPFVLNVWATWCPPCREELPALDKMAEHLKGGTDVAVLALSVDTVSAAQVQAFLKARGIDELVLFRGEPEAVLQALRVPGLPTTLLIDREGREVGRLVGATAWDSESVMTAVRQLLLNR